MKSSSLQTVPNAINSPSKLASPIVAFYMCQPFDECGREEDENGTAAPHSCQ